MKKTKTPQTPQLQEPDTQSKRRLSLPKVAYSAFLCVMMSMMFCQPAYAATDVWTKAKEIMQDVYTQILAISTIAAIVTASVALLLMNFSRSGRTVDESRAWLKRICITWATRSNSAKTGGIVKYACIAILWRTNESKSGERTKRAIPSAAPKIVSAISGPLPSLFFLPARKKNTADTKKPAARKVRNNTLKRAAG